MKRGRSVRLEIEITHSGSIDERVKFTLYGLSVASERVGSGPVKSDTISRESNRHGKKMQLSLVRALYRLSRQTISAFAHPLPPSLPRPSSTLFLFVGSSGYVCRRGYEVTGVSFVNRASFYLPAVIRLFPLCTQSSIARALAYDSFKL